MADASGETNVVLSILFDQLTVVKMQNTEKSILFCTVQCFREDFGLIKIE